MKIVIKRKVKEAREEALRLVKQGYEPVIKSMEWKYWIAREPGSGELIKIITAPGRKESLYRRDT